MPKYRKKPVVVEALRWAGDINDWPEMWDFINAPDTDIERYGCDPQGRIKIETLEGVMTASPGDWVIRGVKGEIYPCKPDIFEATYDPVEPLDAQQTPSTGAVVSRPPRLDATPRASEPSKLPEGAYMAVPGDGGWTWYRVCGGRLMAASRPLDLQQPTA